MTSDVTVPVLQCGVAHVTVCAFTLQTFLFTTGSLAWMIAALLLRKRGNHVQPGSDFFMTESSRAAAICSRARERLKPFADISESEVTPRKLQKIWDKAGGADGTGIMLRLAEIDIDGGELSPQAMASFASHAAESMELLQSVALNFTVIFSLFLTINVSILVMHAGNPAYAYDVSHREASSIAFGGGDDAAAWSDLASYTWPEDPSAQRSLRRHLYLAEVLSLLTHIFLCLQGMIYSTFNFSFLGPGLPLISKLELYVDDPNSYTYLHQFDVITFTLPVVLGFVTARSSAIASLASFAVFGIVMINMTYTAQAGYVTKCILAQHKQARIVLAGHRRVP